ncbi:MAG: hypothetical protein U9N52_13310 [Campylobacterota bacterium]|nr:hypothetical protein [Campylobacterota bacterium]
MASYNLLLSRLTCKAWNLYRLLFLLLLVSTLSFASRAHYEPTFNIRSDFPRENPWIKRLLKQSHTIFKTHFAHEFSETPKKITVIIKKDARMRRISGGASFQNNQLHFKSDIWQDDRYRRWILIHELVNLLSAHYGSEAYPSDWWSNGRSPFPVFVTAIILKELRYSKDAHWLRHEYKNKKDHELYWKLYEQYGTKIFRNLFYYLKRDGIDLSYMGKKWPHPDKNRSLYLIGYLSLSAGENLAPLFQKHDIGKRPNDWHKRHKEIIFRTYTITSEDVEQFIAAQLKMQFSQDKKYIKRFQQGSF